MNAESRPAVNGTASKCLLGGDIPSISPEAHNAHKRWRATEIRRRASRELDAICEHLYPRDERPAPVPLPPAPAERRDYLDALAHADDPEVARSCGYGPWAVPSAWQAWEIERRFGTEVAA